jgi:hypothetical protein
MVGGACEISGISQTGSFVCMKLATQTKMAIECPLADILHLCALQFSQVLKP